MRSSTDCDYFVRRTTLRLGVMKYIGVVCNVIMTNLKRHMQHKWLQGLCTKIVSDAVNDTVKLKERIS